MISYAPEPEWSDLLPIATVLATDADRLSAPWRRENDRAFWFGRSSFAFRAIRDWMVDQLKLSSPIIWFPDYFCNSALAPLRRVGVHIRFYPVGSDLSPDWKSCREMAQEAKPHLFVLVHYFGQPAAAELASEFCQTQGALLLEDAAHTVGPTPGIGVFGDFTIYSPYKILPIPDGGLMVMNGKISSAGMAGIVENLSRKKLTAWSWISKKSLRLLLPAAAQPYQKKQLSNDFSTDGIGSVFEEERGMSDWAKRCLAFRNKQLEAISSQRLSNQRDLIQIVESAIHGTLRNIVTPLTVSRGCPPYRFVLRFSALQDAEIFFGKMIELGCPVESWPDLPPEVLDEPVRHREAVRFRNTVVLIPVHQSVDMDILGPMVAQSLNPIVEARRGR